MLTLTTPRLKIVSTIFLLMYTPIYDVNMVVILPPVWIIILFAFIDKSYAFNTTACFNIHGCNSFNLTCPGDQKIQITGAEYRYIRDNRTIGVHPTCCPLNINDCKANYSYEHAVVLFTTCSGKTNCFGNLAPQPKDVCQAWNVSRYIYVSYDCIPGDNLLDMCQANRQASEVDIMFRRSLATTNTTATCVCYVQSQHTIYYELIDVRLFTNVTPVDGKYACLSSNFSINNSLIQCHNNYNDRSFKYMNSPEFTGNISAKPELSEVMWVTFTRDAKPEMVWVKLKADDNFSLYCSSSPLTTSTGKTDTKQGINDNGKSISMTIGVVVAVITVIALVAVPILILKRRQKLRRKDNTQISQLPKGLINHAYTSCKEAGDTYAVVETSAYESINDNSVLTDSKPIKNNNETRCIHEYEGTTKNDDISARYYDRIELEMKDTIKSSNYDFLPAVDIKAGDDTCSHVSDKSQSVTTAKYFANDYSHCKPSSNDTLRNDDDYSHCKPISTLRNDDDYSHCKPISTLRNDDDYSHCKPISTLRNDDDYSHCKPISTLRNDADYSHCKPISTLRNDEDYSHCKAISTLRNDDDYSHVDLDGNCKNNQQPKTNEDSSYNHIDLDDTKHPVRNENAIVDDN